MDTTASLFPGKPHLSAWDRDYKLRGKLWRGEPVAIIDLPEGSRVLELGCGNGKTLSGMLKKPWNITALDISPNAIALCEILVAESKSKHAQIDFIVADVCHLPIPDEFFDAVFAYHVLAHSPAADRKQMSAEIARVLQPSGRLFFRDFATNDMRAQWGTHVENNTILRGTDIMTHYFEQSEVSELFPDLEMVNIINNTWKQKVNGEMMMRSEWEAEFKKRTD